MKNELEEKQVDELPTDVLLSLLTKEMAALGPGTPFLVDGFPRSQSDLISWDKKFGMSLTIDFCIFFALPQLAAEAAVAPDELEDARARYANPPQAAGDVDPSSEQEIGGSRC